MDVAAVRAPLQVRRGDRHNRGPGVSGPTFHYANTWQLIINTGTTIITFLIMFPIQKPRHYGHSAEAGRTHPRE
jgi:hypothetical protein